MNHIHVFSLFLRWSHCAIDTLANLSTCNDMYSIKASSLWFFIKKVHDGAWSVNVVFSNLDFRWWGFVTYTCACSTFIWRRVEGLLRCTCSPHFSHCFVLGLIIEVICCQYDKCPKFYFYSDRYLFGHRIWYAVFTIFLLVFLGFGLIHYIISTYFSPNRFNIFLGWWGYQHIF